MTKLIRPALYITECVDPSPTGDISDLLAIAETDQTLTITIIDEAYPSISLDADDLAALTNLLNHGEKTSVNGAVVATSTPITHYINDLAPTNPYHMGPRSACISALEHIEAIDDLLDIICPDHNIAATTEEYLSGLITMIQTRLATIEDAIAAQSPIPSPRSPVPSPHNATLSQQEPNQT